MQKWRLEDTAGIKVDVVGCYVLAVPMDIKDDVVNGENEIQNLAEEHERGIINCGSCIRLASSAGKGHRQTKEV